MTKLSELGFSLPLAAELDELQKNKKLTLVNVGNAMAKSFLVQELQHQQQFSHIFWLNEEEKTESLHLNAALFWGEENICIVKNNLDLGEFYQVRAKILDRKNPQLFLLDDFNEALEPGFCPAEADINLGKILVGKNDEVKIYPFFERLTEQGYAASEDENLLKKGEFLRKGDELFIFPMQSRRLVRISFFGDEVEKIEESETQFCGISDKGTGLLLSACKKWNELGQVVILPAKFSGKWEGYLMDIVAQQENVCVIADDVNFGEMTPSIPLDQKIQGEDKKAKSCGNFFVEFTTFPDSESRFFHLNFFSVLPFYTVPDFVTEVKERFRREFDVVVMTKKKAELIQIFRDNEIMFTEKLGEKFASTLRLVEVPEEEFLPHSFQNNDQKLLFLTDREIFQFRRSASRKKSISGMNQEMMSTLKVGDPVVHLDHGIGIYEGIVQRELQKGEVREFLKLRYLNNDRLFVPVDAAEKLSRYIGDDEPKLTKLGGGEWQKVQKKIKAETEKVAKELLKIYAKRAMAKGSRFVSDEDPVMQKFCDSFPYTLTPGQAQSWNEVRMDMEKAKPMDRLVCGDVGFGKTEVAMRAAFKAFRSGMQCAILAPITILAEQHYEGLQKRIEGQDFGVKIALLSRFQSAAEQKKILLDIKTGLVNIVIGTHRLLSDDIKFKNLGLLIVDEEQRFGVKQKEKLKNLRANVDLLTLTATPIPRTLHMGLNKLKDVSTIVTPPPGRLPVVTEVRKYSLDLIRERIMFEVNRGGQVYFLHNQVQTIESQTEQLRQLMPDVRFIVAHGQLSPQELEKRIHAFKDGEADVLVASTIVENGIDLPNANTLLVNRSEKFGLSQLYQLRGRVGRGRTQAYAFFLYQGQKLAIDARKRLRAIVEASELGSGFQIAMKDLEIRGAGEILGANQAGTMKDAGISHFVRMLNKAVEDMKSGKQSVDTEEEENISVELPFSAYIPPAYIPNTDEKIRVYQELSAADSVEALDDYRNDLKEDYGTLPLEVRNLCRVLKLKLLAKEAHLAGIKVHKTSHQGYEMILRLGNGFTPDRLFGLLQSEEGKAWKMTTSTLVKGYKVLPVGWYEELVDVVGGMGSRN